jgi:hypothetical protein
VLTECFFEQKENLYLFDTENQICAGTEYVAAVKRSSRAMIAVHARVLNVRIQT